MRRGGWTDYEKNQLATQYQNKIPIEQIAASLGRTVDATKQMRNGLKLSRRESKLWTEAENIRLRELWLDTSISCTEIARALGRTEGACRQQAMMIGVRRSTYPAKRGGPRVYASLANSVAERRKANALTRAGKPAHAVCHEPYTLSWYLVCNKAFRLAMEANPDERPSEIKLAQTGAYYYRRVA